MKRAYDRKSFASLNQSQPIDIPDAMSWHRENLWYEPKQSWFGQSDTSMGTGSSSKKCRENYENIRVPGIAVSLFKVFWFK